MPGLDDLPPELACQILENLSICDVFTARSVSRSFLSFVDRHVEMVAYGLARRNFPNARLLLRPTREDGVYDIAWLRALVPRRLAAIALDKHRVHRHHAATSYTLYIPAEDDFGDELRARLAGAWCVLQRIGDAYRAVYALSKQQEEDEGETIPATFEAREALVYERVLALIERLEPNRCEAFCLLAYLLLSAFEDKSLPEYTSWRQYLTFHVAQEGEPSYFLDCRPRLKAVRQPPRRSVLSLGGGGEPRFKDVVVDSRHPDRGNTWVWSFLFREGAEAFRWQWIGGGGGESDLAAAEGHVAKKMAWQWCARSPERIHAERECASRIWYALVMRSRAASTPGKPQQQQLTQLTPPPDYNSLKNPPNDYAFPAIDRWLLLRRRARAEAPSKTMLEWHLWQEGLLDINAECGVFEDWKTKEEAAELFDNNYVTDSLRDVPYRVRF
ncbi:hypothetical protein F5X99DRAFT_44494 [Biscogniauxia marginata]|nr:hypothetical protein F5X99DRAFT_44494 [Biscogniauxia marginata]